MIYDSFGNKNLYVNTHPLFRKAFEYLENYLKNPIAPGRYEICGNDLFVMVQDYETRDEGLLEAHDEYIDIQCMISGSELVYYTNRDYLNNTVSHDAQKDLIFFGEYSKCSELVLAKGEFMIFFPNDAHKPAMAVMGERAFVKKLVFKVKADYKG